MVIHMEEALRHFERHDPALKEIISQVGPFDIGYHPASFHSLAKSIVYQQLSGKAAATILGRLTSRCGVQRLNANTLLELSESDFRAVGVSTQKAASLRDLAERTRSGEIRFARLRHKSDDEIIEELTRVRGIGVWTAQMFLMFALRRPDVFPLLDLGVRNGMRKVYGLDESTGPAGYLAIAERWKPWRSVGSWYMWRSLEL